MHYTTAVIKETMRMWPVVSTLIPRVAIKDTYLGEL